jgi:hypothetical protein
MGFEPRIFKFKVKFRLNRCTIYPLFVGTVRTVHRLCILYRGISLTTEEINTKNLRQGSLKVSVRQDSICRNGSLLQVAKTSCQSWSPFFRVPGSTLGQRRYLPSYVTKRFLTSSNFVSNPSVRHITSAMSYSPISDRSLRVTLFKKKINFLYMI